MVVIHFTDGGISMRGIDGTDQVSVALDESPWNQLTLDAFRWDQV